MSVVKASDTVTDCTEDPVTHTQSDYDVGVSTSTQILQDVENRLVTLSEKITMCNEVMNDLKHLNDVLVRKSLRDVSLPPQN